MAVASMPQRPAVSVTIPDGLEAEIGPAGAAAPRAAAAADSELPFTTWLAAYVAAVGIAGLAYAVSYLVLLPACQRSTDPCGASDIYRVGSDFTVFAALFALALAVERLLEPFSRFVGTEKAKDERDEAEAATLESPSDSAATGLSEQQRAQKTTRAAVAKADGKNVDWLAAAQAKVDHLRKIFSIVAWGVAAAFAFILAAELNVLLLAAIATEGSAQPAPWADLLVTGLVVGAGTKPLHDLVSRLEKSKEKAEDPTTTGGKP